MKKYRGERIDEFRVKVSVDGEDLPLRLDLYNHSPDGFNWGYYGSGPAQLGLAILADYLNDDERALRLHQAFKADFISKLGDSWTLIGADIKHWLDKNEVT